MNPSNFFDLSTGDITGLEIVQLETEHDCRIRTVGEREQIYIGFIIAKSQQVSTLCEVNFHLRATGLKYIPRLSFVKIKNANGVPQSPQREDEVRISIQTEEEGIENFWKMVGFLYQYRSFLDLGEVFESLRLVNTRSVVDFGTADRALSVQNLLGQLNELGIDEGEIKEIVQISRRRDVLEFQNLIENPQYRSEYRERFREEITGNGDEPLFHHFLKKHTWLFGLNLDIRFISEFVSEASIGTTDTTGRGAPTADFLGYTDYTVLVELKTPDTKFFTDSRRSTSRANTWSFSSDFVDGISQCLGQKAVWETGYSSQQLVNNGGEVVNQNIVRTTDPKVIFLIGNKRVELPPESTEVGVLQKRDTLERFRRNSRNVEVLTYDELLERARFTLASGNNVI